MIDLTQHYAMLLGLREPWYVESVDIVSHKTDPDQVVIRLKHKTTATTRFHCPDCDQPCPIADHTPERTWRHLDTMQFQTVIVARVPRTGCSNCGDKTVKIPWAAPHGRFTLLLKSSPCWSSAKPRATLPQPKYCAAAPMSSNASSKMRSTEDFCVGVT
jgi:transposase